MEHDFVAVAAFSHTYEAHLVMTRLESEGLRCRIGDENTVTINWLLSNAIGGVKVMVHPDDFKKARAILIECGIIKEPLPEDGQGMPAVRSGRWRTLGRALLWMGGLILLVSLARFFFAVP